MGCDGGTIPRRDELVRVKKKPEAVSNFYQAAIVMVPVFMCILVLYDRKTKTRSWDSIGVAATWRSWNFSHRSLRAAWDTFTASWSWSRPWYKKSYRTDWSISRLLRWVCPSYVALTHNRTSMVEGDIHVERLPIKQNVWD